MLARALLEPCAITLTDNIRVLFHERSTVPYKCFWFVAMQVDKALREAHRVLKPGGRYDLGMMEILFFALCAQPRSIDILQCHSLVSPLLSSLSLLWVLAPT